MAAAARLPSWVGCLRAGKLIGASKKSVNVCVAWCEYECCPCVVEIFHLHVTDATDANAKTRTRTRNKGHESFVRAMRFVILIIQSYVRMKIPTCLA